MGDLQIKVRCWVCQGDGIYQDSTCPSCNGLGKLDTPEGVSSIDITEITDKLDDILDKATDILDKCNDIFEKVNNG